MGILNKLLSVFNKKAGDQLIGEVKWFSSTKGYGFIKPLDGSPDVFVHISAVTRAGLRTLNKGQQVSYELEKRDNRISAVNLQDYS